MQDLFSIRKKLENYKKIKQMTDATKLASITSYSICSKRLPIIKTYCQLFAKAAKNILIKALNQKNSQSKETTNKALFIFVGPSKELCASSFYALGKYFGKILDSNLIKNADIIAVGKNCKKYIKGALENAKYQIIEEHPLLNLERISFLSAKISDQIFELLKQDQYDFVGSINLGFKSFFFQDKKFSILCPIDKNKLVAELISEASEPEVDPILEQNHEDLLLNFEKKIISLSIAEKLLDSLMAEYAARFVAINKASSNAAKLIEEMTIYMNKVRQINITKQMAEISTAVEK